MMVVGISRVTLVIPGNDSLKGKRSVVNRLLERVRSRFHVSAAEVDSHDQHQRAVLGFATVGSDAGKVDGVLRKLTDFVADSGLAELTAEEREVVSYDDVTGDPSDALAEKFGFGGEAGSQGESGARFRPGSLGRGSQALEEE